jgi:hypothetical protein
VRGAGTAPTSDQEEEVDAMWWEVAIPTLTPDGTRLGVQVFTYPTADIQFSEARTQALADAISADAVRHRRGAGIDVEDVKIRTRTLDIRTLD